jgi:hypothetical protein
MSNITGVPKPNRTIPLYISGSSPIILPPNIYDTVIQTDGSIISVTLPSATLSIDGFEISLIIGIGGTINIHPHSGDTINGTSILTLNSSGITAYSLIIDTDSRNWFILSNNSNGGGSGPLPASSQILYVNMGGSDTTGDGTENNPYLTITHAMNTITDALWEKRYKINIGPGNWSDNFAIKAWVFLTGSQSHATRLTGSITINDPTWANPGSHSDERSGFQDLAITGTIVLDFTLTPSPFGKVYFYNTNINNVVNMTGQNPVNQVYAFGGQWFGGVTYTGINFVMLSVDNEGGDIVLNSSSTAASFTGIGGRLNGNLNITYTSGTSVLGDLNDFVVLGTVNVSGVSASLSSTSSSLPPQSSITISNGAIFTRSNDSYGLGFVANMPNEWNGSPPTNVQDALNRIASLVYILNGSNPIP